MWLSDMHDWFAANPGLPRASTEKLSTLFRMPFAKNATADKPEGARAEAARHARPNPPSLASRKQCAKGSRAPCSMGCHLALDDLTQPPTMWQRRRVAEDLLIFFRRDLDDQ